MAVSPTIVDEGRLQEFVGRFANDLGAALHQTTVLIGDKLGLYAAMSDGEPVTPKSSPRGRAPTSVTCASGCAHRPLAATPSTTATASVSS